MMEFRYISGSRPRGKANTSNMNLIEAATVASAVITLFIPEGKLKCSIIKV